MKLFLLLCFFVGVGFAQLCRNANERIEEGCVTCTCEPNPGSSPPTRKWVCVQTCMQDECPDEIVSQVCAVNQCKIGLYCTTDQDAECVIPDCNNCTYAWRKNGQDVDCPNTGEVIKTGMCPVPSNSTGGICVEMCSADQDCRGNRKCCSNGCGHTCTKPVNMPAACPIVPDDTVGTCEHECRAGPPGHSGCPPGQLCCFNGCGLSCQRPMPIGCGEDGVSEDCGYDACEDANCTTMANATCVTSECGRCRPKFFVDGEEVECAGQKTCRNENEEDDRVYVTGERREQPDGCNSCVCTGRGWRCTERDCSNLKLINVILRLNGTFDRIKNRTDRLIGKLKKVLSNKFPGLPPTSMRNFKFRRGSIVVEFMVASDGTTEVDSTIQKLESEVTGGNFSFDFEGEMLLADSDSFQSEDVTPTSKAGKLTAVYMVICVLAMLAIVNPA